MQTRTTITAAATLLALCGAAFATNYDPTGQAGQYEHTKTTTVVRGSGAATTATIWAPWILPEADAAQNSAVVQVDAQGVPYGAVSTFGGQTNPFRGIAAFGTTDAAGFNGVASNNTFITEGITNRSNSFGELVNDGTAVWRANFAGLEQNNLEFRAPLPWPASTSPVGAGTKVFGAFPGIDDTFGGTAQLGTPGAERFNGTLYTGVAAFDSGTQAIPVGVNVYAGQNNNPNAPFASWLQTGAPVPTIPAGLTSANTRQTQPVVRTLAPDCNPDGELFVMFGVGFSGSSVTGGSARPVYFVIDQVNSSNWSDGFVFIDADGDNDLSTANPDIRFVDHQATGGGTGPFTGGQFSINRRGQVVAVVEDRTVTPRGHSIRLYNPIWDENCNLVGYEAPIDIAVAGQDGIENNINNTTGTTTFTLLPLSGAAIDDNGNVSFTAITEVVTDVNAMGAPVLLGSTNSLFFWHAASDSLHRVVDGGLNGDVLPALNSGPDLKLGFFPVDTASDNFTRAGFSSDGLAMAFCFRNRGAANPAFPGFTPDGGNFVGGASVRGVVVVQLEEPDVSVPCPGDYNNDGVVDFGDLSTVLGAFGSTFDFNDLSLVLSNFGAICE
ncbi:MAG: hypothetical protein EA379_06740 [Phycisphaerales bacterium]|nr:MAG: hypothetical protein EA379_06740 [Phycisphaerales bacterium]